VRNVILKLEILTGIDHLRNVDVTTRKDL